MDNCMVYVTFICNCTDRELQKTREISYAILCKLKSEDKIIVTTNGSFDILHPAHINLLKKAKEQGSILIVLLNSDSSIKKLKGSTRPIMTEKDRAFMLSALEPVDYVVIFNEEKPLEILKTIKPHKHVKGGSFVPERIKEEQSLLSQWNGQFISLPLEEGYSTTNIIEKIKDAFKG